MTRKKKQIVYVYEDMDHCDIEVFDTYEKALAHFMECWGHEPEWEGSLEKDGEMHDLACDYVTIHKKEVQ